jgi:hypothetical protein
MGRPHRTASIRLEGVGEALMALRQRKDKPGGAACLDAIGRLGRDDGSGKPRIRGILR